MKNNRVHVAFGFHVNCYHSYRGDTPDALGFGGDIRIMRHILDTLDDRNSKGIPVRGTWDFENAYSLERILPEYAPDIIERVRARGDENIIMGYNNGAMSAMTDDEFRTSVEWAVTNPYRSGIRDIFGSCEMIIRPQEVMFTPTQARLYSELGVKAVCLYYSCISFDAFRTLIPQLDDERSFNPLTYKYGGGEITVIPTYSPNDIMDAGSLRALCADLHYKQVTGEIDRDVLIFVNTDADSFLWEPMAVPKPLTGAPCFGGIGGYIDEVAGLDYVVFDTPGGYLKDHGPAGEIAFGQDVADGNLSGYMSWSEKPFNRLIWTRLERARAMAKARGLDEKSPSFETRVRLLSTTHFGLASPVMNVTREEKAKDLTKKMLYEESDAMPLRENPTVLDPEGTGLCAVQLRYDIGDITRLRLSADGLEHWGAVKTGGDSIFLMAKFGGGKPEHELSFSEAEPSEPKKGGLSVGDIEVCPEALPYPVIKLRGEKVAEIKSWISYGGERCSFVPPTARPLPAAGEAEGVRLTGEIHLPGELTPGSYTFDFFTVAGFNGVYIRSAVQYPYTREDHEISSQASNLGRYSDPKWSETAPLEITIKTDDGCTVRKRSFAGRYSEYRIADFWEAFPENANISSINHQLTAGPVTAGGLILTHSRLFLGSMAHLPMRLRSEGHARYLSLNPFGTYFGPQRHYPTRGNGSSMGLYLAAAPQARSLAPAYNGAYEEAVQALYPEGLEREAELFSDGSVALGCAYEGDNVKLREAVGNKVDPKDLKSVTFVEQIGGVGPAIDLVRRYTENLLRAEKKRKRLEKLMGERQC